MLASIKNQLTRQTQTVIGPNTVLKGNLHFTGKLRLEGCVLGDVIANTDSARVEMALSAVVHGNLEVPVAVVHGAVHGDLISGKRVTIKRGGRIEGDVHYKRIDIASGARVKGEVVRLPDSSGLLDVQPQQSPESAEDSPSEKATNPNTPAPNRLQRSVFFGDH